MHFILFLRNSITVIHYSIKTNSNEIPPKLSACSERSAYSIASGASNSSYGNSSTATVSNEPTSLLSDDLMPEDFETGAYGKILLRNRC